MTLLNFKGLKISVSRERGLVEAPKPETPPVVLIPKFKFGQRVRVVGDCDGFYDGAIGTIQRFAVWGETTYEVRLQGSFDSVHFGEAMLEELGALE